MKQTILNPSKTINCKKSVIILLVISLVFSAINSVDYFVYYEYVFSNTYRLVMHNTLDNIFSGSLSFILNLAPMVLLLAYIFKYNDAKYSKLVFFAFLAIVMSYLFSIVTYLPLFINANVYYRNEMIKTYLGSLLLNIVYLITYSLATISAKKGMKNKIFIIIPTAVCLVVSAISLFSLPKSINFLLETGRKLYIITSLAGTLSAITLNVALLVFGLKNTIEPIIKTANSLGNGTNAVNQTREQALILLKNKLDNGMITEEEYQLQRTEIINML